MRQTEIELLDPLTGIYSRASLMNRLQEEVDRSTRYGQPFSILLLDLDHFKSVNDAFGHRRGDDVLIELASRLGRHARKSDVVFRYGGDEFIILLPSTDNAAALGLAERLFELLREEPYSGNPSLTLTSSLGIASFPKDAESMEGLFDVADKRHYQAKRQGRNRIVSRDVGPADSLSAQQVTRVIDREMALDQVYGFFKRLAVQRQGALTVIGPIGAGKTRFLEEVAKVARLHGHLVLPVNGKKALRSRAYGAILESERRWDSLPSIAEGEGKFLHSLEQLLLDKGNIGVVFTVDNHDMLDSQSLATLERVFFSPILPHIALAYSQGDDSLSPYTLDAQFTETIKLGPFTKNGVHIWLRQVLKWEAPEPFIEWLYENTEGLPERLRQSLQLLASEGFLQQAAGGWRISESPGRGSYRNFPLGYYLEKKRQKSTSRLPNELKTFVGRTSELRKLKKAVRASRLVNVVGPGGIGKSRLALQAAIEMEEEFPDGVFYVSLAGIGNGRTESGQNSIITLISNTVGLSLSGKEDILTQLLHFLEGKKMLLLVNGYGEGTSASPVLERILDVPQPKILIAARKPAGLAGESSIELTGLDYPETAAAAGAMHYEAVQLFNLHARRTSPDFSLRDGNLDDVIRICRIVGGLPLGIELAATWVSQFTCGEIARHIEENYSFLAGPETPEVPDVRSIQAVFDYFWGLLSDSERRVLAKLSTFKQEFDEEAARRVTNASPFFLGALTSRVFLIRSSNGAYRMHNLLRQFSAENLQEMPDAVDSVQLAHSRYYLDLLRSQGNNLRGQHQKSALNLISGSLENVLAAWNWAIEHREYDLINGCIEALYLYFNNLGKYREGNKAFYAGADLMLARASDEERQQETFERTLARVRLRGAIFHSMIGFLKDARDVMESCLEIAIRHEEKGEIALCYEHIGWMSYDLGLPRKQIMEYWQKSLALFREMGASWGVARLLYNLSFISPLEENYKLMKEKLEITTRLGDVIGIAETLLSLGGIYEQRGEIQEALNHNKRSLQIYEQIGHLDGIGNSHFGLGNVYYSQGEYDNALACFEKALHFFRRTGNVNGISTSLSRTCRVAIDRGEYEYAREGLKESLALEKKAGSKIGTAYALNFLGELALAEKDLPEARSCLEQSFEIIKGAEDRWGMGRALANLARLAILESDLNTGLHYAKNGIAVSRRMGETLFVHNNVLAAGIASLGLGNLPEAGRTLLAALKQAKQRSSPPLMLDTLLACARYMRLIGKRQESNGFLQLVSGHPAAPFRIRQEAQLLLQDEEDPGMQWEGEERLLAQVTAILEAGLDE